METIKFQINDEVTYGGGYATIKEISEEYQSVLILCPLLFSEPVWVQISGLRLRY